MGKNMIVKVMVVEEWCEEHRYGIVSRFKRADRYTCPVCTREDIKYLMKEGQALVCPSCEVVHFSEGGDILTPPDMISALKGHWRESKTWIEFIHDISISHKKTIPELH